MLLRQLEIFFIGEWQQICPPIQLPRAVVVLAGLLLVVGRVAVAETVGDDEIDIRPPPVEGVGRGRLCLHSAAGAKEKDEKGESCFRRYCLRCVVFASISAAGGRVGRVSV